MQITLLASKEQKDELLGEMNELPDAVSWFETPVNLNDLTDKDVCIDLLFDNTDDRIDWLKQGSGPLIIVNSVVRLRGNAQKDFARINGWTTFLKRPLIEVTASDERRDEVEKVMAMLNKKTEWTPDINGFISARVVASIINEAYFALEQGVSTKAEIDTAMKLGTNYPYGPFEWSQKIGLKNVHSLLLAMEEEQERYQPSKLLIKEACA